MRNKEAGFWKGLERWDIIVLTETWVEERGWNGVRRMLPKGFVWETQWARRLEKRGRAMGGMIIGVRKEIQREREEAGGEEALMYVRVKLEDRWKVVGVYVNGDLERKLERMGEWIEEGGFRETIIIGGDFNARTGNEGGEVGEEDDEGERGKGSRRSKDMKVNAEGRRLIRYIGERG